MRSFLVSLILMLALGVPSNAGGDDSAGHPAPPEAKTADQLRWEEMIPSHTTEQPALRYVQEDPALPRVLLIGDSISVGYTTRTQDALRGKANVWRVPRNAGSTAIGLEHIDQWLAWRAEWDVIHFNFGLHDLVRDAGGSVDLSGPNRIPAEEYAANLERIVERLQATGAELVFATTTPVPEGAAGRVAGDELRYNEAAEAVMRRHGIHINDLHGYIEPHLDIAQRPANVHFNAEGNDLFAARVSAEILSALERRRGGGEADVPSTRPAER